MNYTQFSWLRTILRKLGILHLLTAGQRKKVKEREAYYAANKPTSASMQLNGQTIQMHTADMYEYVRVQSFEDDKPIIAAITQQLSKGETFWDIGTSIGLYSNYVAKVVGTTGHVISYEPELRSRERLLENIAFNNNTGIIQVVNYALGKEKGSFTMELAEKASAGNHKILSAGESSGAGKTQTVEVLTADEVIGLLTLPQPNAVKIDVEGQEENVILGAKSVLSNPACHTIVIEIHFSIFSSRNDDGGPARIQERLQEYGFNTIQWIDASHIAGYKNK
jgi:FkbM family methyltransferase